MDPLLEWRTANRARHALVAEYQSDKCARQGGTLGTALRIELRCMRQHVRGSITECEITSPYVLAGGPVITINPGFLFLPFCLLICVSLFKFLIFSSSSLIPLSLVRFSRHFSFRVFISFSSFVVLTLIILSFVLSVSSPFLSFLSFIAIVFFLSSFSTHLFYHYKFIIVSFSFLFSFSHFYNILSFFLFVCFFFLAFSSSFLSLPISLYGFLSFSHF